MGMTMYVKAVDDARLRAWLAKPDVGNPVAESGGGDDAAVLLYFEGLHWLLTGSMDEELVGPAAFLFEGRGVGAAVGVGGPARVMTAEEVVPIARLLADTSIAELLERAEPPPDGLYRGLPEDDSEREELEDEYEQLRIVTRECEAAGQGLLIWID